MIAKPTAGRGRPKRAPRLVVAPAHRDRRAHAGRVGLDDDARSSRASRAARRGRGSRRRRRRGPPAGPSSPRQALAGAGAPRAPRGAIRSSSSRPPRSAGSSASRAPRRPVRAGGAREPPPLDEVPRARARRCSAARAPASMPRPSSTAAVSDDVAHADAQPLEPGGAQALHQQRDHLGVGRRAGLAHQLDAGLPLLRRPAGARAPAGGRPGPRTTRAPGRGGRPCRVATRRATGMVRSGRSTSTRPLVVEEPERRRAARPPGRGR